MSSWYGPRQRGMSGWYGPAHLNGARLKSAFLTGELGQTGVDVLRKIKAALDPGQIMNPRNLLP